jgi:hypothetical protein
MSTTTVLYLVAAGLAVAALVQLRKAAPTRNMDGSGGRPWSEVPNQSAAETARLAAWARTAQPMPDQTDAETARLIRQANPYRW